MRGTQVRKVLAGAMSLAFLGGCSMAKVGPMNQDVEKMAVEASARLDDLRSNRKVEQAPVISSVELVQNGMYIPVRKISASKAAKVENSPALQRQIAMNRTFVSAQDFAERVTGLTGIPSIVAPDVLTQPGAANSPLQGGAMPQAMAPGMPAFPTPLGGSQFGLNSMNQSGFPINLSYSGPVSGLLDVASARMGVSWEMRDGQIKLFRFASKTFRLTALPGDTSMDAAIGNATSSGSVGGSGGATSATQANSSAQTAGVKFTGLSVWKGIEDSVKTMLTTQGKVFVAPALGTITITDIPSVVANVERFIDDQNAALSKQVVVNVRVLSLDLTNSDSYGINWDAVYTAMSKNWGFSFNSGIAAATGSGSLTASILGTAGQATNSSIQSWAGSKAIIDALSLQGRVSTVTSASITTLNNQPSPIQVGRQTSYVAASTTTITSGVATTSLTPGMVSTGFSMTMVPHVIEGRKMLLQYAIDMSSLLAMNTVASGGSSLQTPDLDARTSIQRLMVNSGDTIVVTGFENNEVNAKTQGVLDANNPALGGAVVGKRNKSTIIILIQPVLADN